MKKKLSIFCLLLASCVETTTTAKDGSVTRTKAPAPGVLPFAAAAIVAYSPRPIKVREEKSFGVNENRFVNIKPNCGSPITDKEIRNRWQPFCGPELP